MTKTTTTSGKFSRGLLLFLLLEAAQSQTTIVDLSQDWKIGALYNQNKAYCTIQAALAPCSTRGYVVIQNGELLAEGYTCDDGANGQYEAYSATKSWSTFFIGVLVDQGKLAISETLGDIFNNNADWEGVEQAAEKKTVTVAELLTMSGGLLPAACRGDSQETLQDVLAYVQYDANQKGQFNYLGLSHILARIIERRSGQSPRGFATSAGIFSKLGMADEDFSWATYGGIEGSATGLMTNPRILAKLGQLYLQGGLAASGDQLVSSSWVEASVQSYVDNDFGYSSEFSGYGYQWYPQTSVDGAAAAFGAQGQTIYFSPAINATIAIMGKGCMGTEVSIELLLTIIDNIGDLSVQQTTCTESFSYLNFFRQHSGQLLRGSVRQASNTLRGRNLD